VPAAPEAGVEREVDELYGLPLAEFVAARDELAKRARAEGQRELAERVKGLRKPTVGAWLVNRLARERELDVQRLLKAGEALAKAQAEAAQGSPEAFREARREEQRALDRLADAAREIAEREGLGATAVDKARQTLRAASLTDEGRELLKQGRLTEELQPPGFEALAGLPAPGKRAAKRPRGRADDRAEQRQAVADARERVRAVRAEERESQKAARAAERSAERAEREAAELREAADRARADAEAAEEERVAAEQDLERLERDRPG
jgi:hypothetical protein